MKNPPAFPVTTGSDGGCLNEGMTLRDYFAAKALQGMLCNGFMPNQVGESPGETYKYEKAAYALADAMLEERSK